jgi:hypothetical protein
MTIKPALTLSTLIAAALLAAGCGGQASTGGPSSVASTALVIRATNNVVGTATFTLLCAPAGGTVHHPAAVCARLAAAPHVLIDPHPLLCPGTPLSPWTVAVSGRRDGQPVRLHFATCWGPQTHLIRVLGISWSQVIHAARSAR